MDGYLLHEQKKQDLQVSKKKGWIMQGGQNEAKMEARGGLTKEEESITVVCIHVYISISYTLSANNNTLCLGYK